MRGGVRENSGRKKATDELQARDLSIKAIESVHGSLTDGLINLLKSEQPMLVKFVYEHAVGKPVDKLATQDEEGNIMPLIINWMKKDE